MSIINIATPRYLEKNKNIDINYLLVDVSLAFNNSQYPYVDSWLPIIDTNAFIESFLKKVSSNIPIIAGLCFTDPYRRMNVFCNSLRKLNPLVSGFMNLPSTSVFSGNFGKDITNSHIGFESELATFSNSVLPTDYSLALVHNVNQAESFINRGFSTLVLSSLNPVFWGSSFECFQDEDVEYLKITYPDVSLLALSYNDRLSCHAANLDGLIHL